MTPELLELYEKMRDISPEIYNSCLTKDIKDVLIEIYSHNFPTIFGTEYESLEFYMKHNINAIDNISSYCTVYKTGTTDHVAFDKDEFLKSNQVVNMDSYSYSCGYCGSNLKYVFKSDSIEVIHNDSCIPKEDFVLKFTVPENGKMVVNDSIGTILKEPDSFVSVNNIKGQIYHSRHAEEQGFVYFSVGNSCPSLYMCHDGSVIIATSYAVHDKNGNIDPRIKSKLASVCTDLWWVTLSSVDNCKSKIKKGSKFRKGEFFDLEPGNWECIVKFDSGDDDIFATMKRVS